jgi:hypothetical protein
MVNGQFMDKARIFSMAFSSVYPLYIQKVEKKGRTKAEVDAVIFWLTGYNKQTLQQQIDKKSDFETFFAQAPQINSNVFQNYRSNLWMSCRRNRRQTHAKDSLLR